MKNVKYFFIVILGLFSTSIFSSTNLELKKVYLDLKNIPSLQKGAKIFFNYCQGCHSIKYMRYSNLAEGIGLSEAEGKSIEQVIKESLMHSLDGINENNEILSSVDKDQSLQWFGKTPPDLSLVSRYRGKDWIYTYMQSFYKDKSRPWGVNNLLFPDVGMPHVLLKFQGVQVLRASNEIKNSESILELIENGELSIKDYNILVKDLVTFLSYVGEPSQVEREDLGYKVIIFLSVLSVCLYLLKKEYWKEIK